MRVARSRTIVLLAALLLPALALACERPPSAEETKEWTAADHDRAEETSRIAAGGQPAASGQRGGGDAALVEATWRQQCLTCHGLLGHGDGPTGPMVKASDLTREEWQSQVSDEAIAATIKNGKGKMPKFDLPPLVMVGLVARIRASRGR